MKMRAHLKSITGRGRGRMLAAIASLASLTLVAQGVAVSQASWLTKEWMRGFVGTLDCNQSADVFASRGEGKLLGGNLLGNDLDALAEVRGVEVTNNGQRSREATGTAMSLGDDAYANPLNVVALSAVDVNLGRGLLQLPLNNMTGVLGQYAQATGDGHAVGASGYITTTGGIATSTGNAYPELATLNLSSLLSTINPNVADLIGGLTEVSLVVGALAGRATLDGCEALWQGVEPYDASSQTGNLTRDYLVSHLYTDIESPVVGALGTEISTVTNTLETTANGLVGSSGVLSSVIGPVVSTVTTALGLVGTVLGLRVTPNGTNATVTALDLDLSSVRSLVNQPFSDADEVVNITLSQGTVRVDTAALLEAAYPGSYSNGLNGLQPNSEPLNDPHVLNTLTARVSAVLTSLLTKVNQKLVEALDTAEITAVISIPLQRCTGLLCSGGWADVGALKVTVTGTLAELLEDEGDVAVDTSVLSGLLPLGSLTTLVNALVSGLTSTVGALVGTAINGVLRPLAQLPTTTMTTFGQPIVNLVTTVYRELYLNGIVSLTINAQNDPFSGNPEPSDWAALPEGRYDVAALRVGVLGALASNDVRLSLARGSVGKVCSPVQIAAGGCADY